jgi:hypothetical protein
MSRLLTTLLAGAAAVSFTGAAFAAEQAKDPQSRDNQTQAQPNATKGKPEQSDAQAGGNATGPAGSSSGAQQSQTGQSNDPVQHNQTENQANKAGADEGNMGRKPDQPGGQATAKEQEYLADMKKCDSMTGAQKKTCVDAAKKRHGQM